jgi:hypothetical protein
VLQKPANAFAGRVFLRLGLRIFHPLVAALRRCNAQGLKGGFGNHLVTQPLDAVG